MTPVRVLKNDFPAKKTAATVNEPPSADRSRKAWVVCPKILMLIDWRKLCSVGKENQLVMKRLSIFPLMKFNDEIPDEASSPDRTIGKDAVLIPRKRNAAKKSKAPIKRDLMGTELFSSPDLRAPEKASKIPRIQQNMAATGLNMSSWVPAATNESCEKNRPKSRQKIWA